MAKSKKNVGKSMAKYVLELREEKLLCCGNASTNLEKLRGRLDGVESNVDRVINFVEEMLDYFKCKKLDISRNFSHSDRELKVWEALGRELTK